MAGSAVKFELLGMIQQRKKNDIQIGNGSKQSAPEDGAVTDFVAEGCLSDRGAQCGLSDGIHLGKTGYRGFGGGFNVFPNASQSNRVMLDDRAICASSIASGAGL